MAGSDSVHMRAIQAIPAVILGLGALLIGGARQQHIMPPTRPMKALPSTIATFRGTDIVVAEAERAIAGMSDYSMRVFSHDTVPAFSLYVGYYDHQVQGKTIHSPKNCLPGAGWEVVESTPLVVPERRGATVNRVLLVNRGTRALVYYWYQGRGRIESSEYRVKWNLLQDAARFGRTEEALVRIIIPLPRPNETTGIRSVSGTAAADSLARVVMRQIMPAVESVLPSSPRA